MKTDVLYGFAMTSPAYARAMILAKQPAPTHAKMTQPFTGSAWSETQTILILRKTSERLQSLGESADNADVQQLSEWLLDDPMMCLRLLADVAALRPGESKIETITGAILMLGVDPFLRRYSDLPAIEQALARKPTILRLFRRLHRRALRSARLAGAFSVAKQDPDIGLIYVAALLGNVDQLLLCVTEPSHAMARERCACDSGQAAALLASLALPTRLTDLVAASPDRIDAQMHRIRLAHHFSRVLESGWSHPEMPALLDELAGALGLTLVNAREVIDRAVR